MKWKRFTREEFYELVWSQRLSEICKEYYVSEEGLIKKCREYEIPIPSLKYWIGLSQGNIPEKKLLESFSGYVDLTFYDRQSIESEKQKTQEQKLRIRNEIEGDKSISLKVPLKLALPDPIIVKIRDSIYKEKVWNKNDGLVFGGYGFVHIQVSPPNVNRALLFMDTIVKALRKRGHITEKSNSTQLIIYGKKYPISCKERERRKVVKERYGDRTILEPSGKLCFRLGESYWLKEWVEEKTPIEEQVLKLLIEIEYRGWKAHEEKVENDRLWAIQKEKERIALELQQRKEKELADFKELFKKSKRHEESEVIRRYIQKLEDSAILRNELTDELKEKIDWARKKADWFDPFIEAQDELLSDVSRDDLTMKKGYF